MDRTQGVRLCDQLLVCYANLTEGKALSKQRLSRWIVAISLAYNSKDLPLPPGVRLIQPKAWQPHGLCLKEYL